MKTYQEKFLLRTCNCDFQGSWRPSAILETMQEAAGIHSELLGCGRKALLEKNAVWVLSRSEVHMNRYPCAAERVTVETFPMPNRRWFFPRYYVFRDEKEDVLGSAGTLWVLLDVNTRKMLPPGDVAALIPDNSDLSAPMGMPATVEEVPGQEKICVRMPQYSDLDVNQHVNNTRYADWACDALGVETMRENFLETLVVNYHAEVTPDQEIQLHVWQDGGQYRVAGYHEGHLHFELGGIMRPRK